MRPASIRPVKSRPRDTDSASVRCVRVIVGALLAVALIAPAAIADLYPGSYSARSKGVSVKLDVGPSGGGSLAYAMKTECGKSKGRLELKRSGAGLKGRRVSRGPENTLRTTVAKVTLSGDGSEVLGTIRDSLRGGGGELAGCHAKRSFSTSAEQAEGFVPSRDLGRYVGTGPNGNPISFDVVAYGQDIRIENLAVDVTAECFDEVTGDDSEIVTHVTGISGRVAKDGTFWISYTPDDDTEHDFEGEIADGKAELDVMIGGYFDAAGIPNAAGPFACDSFGDPYSAARV